MATQLADFPITRRWPPTHPERLQLYTLGTPMGDDYTIADIAIFPWVRGMLTHYLAGELVGIADFPHVTRVKVQVP